MNLKKDSPPENRMLTGKKRITITEMAPSHSPYHCNSDGEEHLLLYTLHMHCLIDFTQLFKQVDFITIFNIQVRKLVERVESVFKPKSAHC